jgi:UDP-N-acetyl-2-amino-2-deoxyglucuronate dehydrogenase
MNQYGKLCVGICGTGQVAVQHVEAFQANPNTVVAGVCGHSAEHTDSFIKSYVPEAKVFSNYEDMLADDKIDIISVCVPNYLHASHAVLALQANKHLVLEKPAGITRDQLDDLAKAARNAKTKTVVSFLLRWMPLCENLKLLVDKGAFGKVFSCNTDYWHGIQPSFSSYNWIRKKEFAGGAMITGGCHAADIARYLNGEVSEVSAYSVNARDDFDYPTTLMSVAKFENGSIGRISASLDGLCFPYQFNIDLLGTKGAVRGNRIYSKELFPDQNDWVTLPMDCPDSGAVSHHPFKQEINEFVDSILHDTPVRSSLGDAVKSMEITLAITESALTGKPEKILEH